MQRWFAMSLSAYGRANMSMSMSQVKMYKYQARPNSQGNRINILSFIVFSRYSTRHAPG